MPKQDVIVKAAIGGIAQRCQPWTLIAYRDAVYDESSDRAGRPGPRRLRLPTPPSRARSKTQQPPGPVGGPLISTESDRRRWICPTCGEIHAFFTTSSLDTVAVT